jgi:hypothetical protein
VPKKMKIRAIISLLYALQLIVDYNGPSLFPFAYQTHDFFPGFYGRNERPCLRRKFSFYLRHDVTIAESRN